MLFGKSWANVALEHLAFVAGLSVRSGRTSADEREAAVAQFFTDCNDTDMPAKWYVLRHPRRAGAVLVDLIRLPRLTATIGDSADGAAIRRAILKKHPLRRVIPHAAVLVLPDAVGDYVLGASKQTLRRKVRKAERAGITWSRVDDPATRQELVALTDVWERENPRAQYRNEVARNSKLLAHPLWLVAYAADGRPLVLSVTPVDGEWGLLRYFKSIGTGEEQSLARYYLMPVLVDHLVKMGVRYLFDVTSPLRLPNGLRHYQRMIGFRIFRIRAEHRHGADTE